MSELDTPIIYNLFPLLAGSLSHWEPHLLRAAEQAFNWIYLNPLSYAGFSGSLYAVKEHERPNPLLLDDDGDDSLARLRPTLGRMRELGLRPIVDLVINHTAKDSPLVLQHPGWYL